MRLGDLIFGAIIGYVVLGLVWLTVEKIARQRWVRRKNRVRSRMSVVRRINVASTRGRKEELPPLRMGGEGR
jgi:hypothetical protein